MHISNLALNRVLIIPYFHISKFSQVIFICLFRCKHPTLDYTCTLQYYLSPWQVFRIVYVRRLSTIQAARIEYCGMRSRNVT